MKDLAASVLARLKKQSKETRLSYQICLQLFCQEEFLRRLSLSRYNSNFILKGGLFIFCLTEFQSRTTQDIDFLMCRQSNDNDNVQQLMSEICMVHTVNDFVTIEVLDAKTISQDNEYHGVSVRFLGHIKQVRVPFSADVGVGDIIVPEPVKRKLKTRLPGFEEPQVYTYSLESTVAEKFDAILNRMEATSRMKDFFDIFYLSNMYDFQGQKLSEALKQTLQHRGTPYDRDCFVRIANFRNNRILVSQWIRYQSIMQGHLPEFSDVLDRIQSFLEPIFKAAIQNRDFLLYWKSAQTQWQMENSSYGN